MDERHVLIIDSNYGRDLARRIATTMAVAALTSAPHAVADRKCDCRTPGGKQRAQWKEETRGRRR